MDSMERGAIANAHPQQGARPRHLMLYACVLLCVVWALPSRGQAQVYRPLQMVRPVPVGPAGMGLDANNRIYRAYPGIEYNNSCGRHRRPLALYLQLE